MDGPERLEDDARPARRATWVVVAVAVAVVVALGAVRFSGLLPDPAPTPTPPGTSPSAAALAGWPQGIGGGTLYVLDGDGVAVVDVSSGRVQRSSLRTDPVRNRLAAGGAGVLVWYEDGGGTPHLVSGDSAATPTVGPLLAGARQLLPGPGEGVWTSDRDARGGAGTERWRLIAPDDTVLSSVSLRGPVVGDGAGGLFARGDGTEVVHVVDGAPTTSWRGSTGAVGLQGWEALECAGRRCEPVLHDRPSGAETPLVRLTTSDFQTPVLSLGSRFVASLQPSPDDGDGLVVRVAVPGARKVLRSFPASSEGPSALVWLSDRWLAATGGDRLVLYDAVDDRLVPLGPGLSAPSQLVLRPV